MPKNNELEKVKLPMKIKFNKKPKTYFKNNLVSISVNLIDYPDTNRLLNYIPWFVGATWAESEYENYTNEEKKKALKEMFEGFTLPGAKETIGLTFRISGISLQEVTHILRHRMATFSADCSGDKWWSDKDALVPNAVENSNEFYERYKKIVNDSKQLYCDMIDSKQISIMDARYILPRCLETFYYMRMNLNDCIAFINQRKDIQIQPETDNIIAYQMFDELLEAYGDLVKDMVDFSNPSPFYQKMARTGKSTNLYPPANYIDTFEWNENDFIYKTKREEMNGTNKHATNIFKSLQKAYFDKFEKYGVKVPKNVE